MKCEYKDKFIEIKGPTGNKGPKGDVGDKGNRGEKGVAGDKGEKGNKGPKGDKGPIGDIGPAGDDGDIGFRGPTGPRGPEGVKGDKGDKGPKGERGPKGDRGDIGPKGDKGEPGIPGEKGDRGPIGDQGPRGPIGITGVTGPKGDIGPKGDKGPQGDIGDTGPEGEAGEVGPQGPKGEIGDIGDIGDTGILGYKRISSGAIIMRKFLRYIIDEGIECYIDTKAPIPNEIEGLFGIDSRQSIANILFDYVFFGEATLITVPIQHITSVSVVFSQEEDRDNFVNAIGDLFNRVKDCKKQTPDTHGINVEGILTERGSLDYRYEFIVQCNCLNDTTPGAVTVLNGGGQITVQPCICQGKKIRVCDIESDEVSIFRKRIELERDRGKQVTKIKTQKGDFTDLVDIDGMISIGPTCYGAAIFTHNKTGQRYIATLVNLDYVCYLEYN